MERVAAPAIETKGVCKRFGSLTAVDRVDLVVQPGEALALLGPNGAGKTTFLEILEGLQAPSAGEVRLFGETWGRGRDAELRRHLGICLQDSRLPEKLEALETLRLFAAFHGLPAARAAEVLEEVGLGDKASTWTQRLSGGQRQRLALGIAMLPRPQLLLLDEPTTGLDPKARRDIWALVERLKAGGCALLLTTHYMEEAQVLCPEVALMHQGRILAHGPVPELIAAHTDGDRIRVGFDRPAPEDALAGLPGLLGAEWRDDRTAATLRVRDAASALPALTRSAAASGAALNALATSPATLDDLFLKLAGSGLLPSDAPPDGRSPEAP